MLPLDYSKARLAAVLAEVRRLKESEFPYPHSKDALTVVEDALKRRVALLDTVSSDPPDSVRAACGESLTDLFRFLPLLGFFLRSTNVRNAFEVYGPLLHLCKLVLGKDTRLILSSEWEDYSPFLKPIPGLPNYVLIGFPASESSNPLLIPLAGHEIGHTIWKKHYQQRIEPLIEKVTNKIFAEIGQRINEYNQIYPAHGLTKETLRENNRANEIVHVVKKWAVSQAEEYFCDFVGLYLFNKAYLHAVAYLLSPTASGPRSPTHPTFLNRAGMLERASNTFRKIHPKGYDVPPGFLELFQNQSEPTERYAKFNFALADSASSHIAPQLMALAQDVLMKAGVPTMEPKEVRKIVNAYRFIVPFPHAVSLVDILNAAWTVNDDPMFWADVPHVKSKDEVLRELVLKNIEVLEIEQITGSAT